MVPEGWHVSSLGEWLSEHREKSTVTDQHPVLTSSRKGLVLQSEYYADGRIAGRDNVGFHVVPPGFITYRSRSDDGHFFFNRNETGEAGIVSHFYPVFRFPRGSDQFFLAFMNYHRRSFLGSSVGTSQKVLSLNALKKSRFPIPPAAEQKKIADILSTWDAAIATTEKLVANAEQQKRGLMQQLLTGKRRLRGFEASEWQPTKLQQVGEIVGGGTPDSEDAEAWDGAILWATPTDITDLSGRYISATERRLSERGLKDSAAKVVPEGSLLVCTRATIGAMAIALEPIATNQGFKTLVPRSGHSVEFLYYLLSLHLHDMVRLACGSTFLELSKRDFANLQLSMPSRREQDCIAEVLNAADDEISVLRQRIAHLRSEKSALMQQLLTGKRRVMV